MRIALNEKQIEGLADFLFDMAKGFALGTIGSTTVTGVEVYVIFAGATAATLCVLGALSLLDRL